MGTVKKNADIKFRFVSLIFTVNMYPTGGGQHKQPRQQSLRGE